MRLIQIGRYGSRNDEVRPGEYWIGGSPTQLPEQLQRPTGTTPPEQPVIGGQAARDGR